MKPDPTSTQSAAVTAAASTAAVADGVRRALRQLLAGTVGPTIDAPASPPSPQPPGFSEPQSSFSSDTTDTSRFNDSVRLARAFSEIDRSDDRQLILALAVLFAQSPSAR